MKMKCVFKCQYAGRTFRPDDTAEIPETDLELGNVRSSFVPDDAPAAPPRVSADAAPVEAAVPDFDLDGGLTRDQYMERLRELRVPFSVRAKRDELKKLFEAATAPQI